MHTKKKQRRLSQTPRKASEPRKLEFSITMREKISENWVRVRKSMKKTQDAAAKILKKKPGKKKN